MDIINLTREVAKALQQDERYIKMQIAKEKSDNDRNLQELIGEFNLKRIAITNETKKENVDNEKIKALNEELKSCYANIMDNENMAVYAEAQKEVENLLKRITTIISKSAMGEDPNTADLTESECSGNCSGCSACN